MRRSPILLLVALVVAALMGVSVHAARVSRQAALEPMQAHIGIDADAAESVLLESHGHPAGGAGGVVGRKPAPAPVAPKSNKPAVKKAKATKTAGKKVTKKTNVAAAKKSVAAPAQASSSTKATGFVVGLAEINKVFQDLNVQIDPKPVQPGDHIGSKQRVVSAKKIIAKSKTIRDSSPVRALVAVNSQVESTTPAVSAQGLEPAGLPATRVALRGSPDPAGFLGKFVYRQDAKTGRIVSASGPVTVKERGTLSDASYLICDRMYFDQKKKARPRTDWQTGHIIASTLGGDDSDPLNFFPQHAQSNSGGGIWWHTELIAGAGARLFTQHKLLDGKAACSVKITVKFDYPSTKSVMASGGTYEIQTSDACLTAALAKGKISSIRYSDVFLVLLSAQAAKVGANRKITIAWKNQADQGVPVPL